MQNQLQQLDQFFAARMDEAVASGFTETFRQNMEHQQVKKVFPWHSSGSILVGFGVKIPEGDLAVLAGQNVFFLDDPFVKIFAKID